MVKKLEAAARWWLVYPDSEEWEELDITDYLDYLQAQGLEFQYKPTKMTRDQGFGMERLYYLWGKDSVTAADAVEEYFKLGGVNR